MSAIKLRGKPRKSQGLEETPCEQLRSTRQKRSFPEEPESAKKARYSVDLMNFSPSSLIKKLDGVTKEELGHCVKSALVDLMDLGEVISTEEYEKRREDVRQQVANPESFDISGRTELNTAGAVLAGAKLIIDETRATRSMCKKLKECGVEQDEILYQPLRYEGPVSKVCQETMESRHASVVESYVDFKKQLNFKSNILEHVVPKQNKKGAKTEQRGLKVKNRYIIKPPHTPANKIDINPLDGERIINNYALEVASTVRENRKSRKIAPIPFNINCLDDVDDLPE